MLLPRKKYKKMEAGGNTAVTGANYYDGTNIDDASQSPYFQNLTASRNAKNKGIDAASKAVAVIPVYGWAAAAALQISKASSEVTQNKYGIYKNKAAEVIDNNVNFIQGAQNIAGLIKHPTFSGTLNFATGGLFGKNAQQEKAKQKKMEAENLIKGLRNKQDLVNSTNRVTSFDTMGDSDNSLYRKGGTILPTRKSSLTSLVIGGDLNEMGADRYEVNGQTHEEGGVKVPQQGIEVEDGETVIGDPQEGKGQFVMSDTIKDPFSGRTFADLHKPIARAMGKLEKKPQTLITRNTQDRLRQREESLKDNQELVKAEMSLGEPISNHIR